MSLILTVTGGGGVVQVSDRLVTLHPYGSQYDRLANKTVICRASDGLFTFSYSGPAYVGEVTTDTWLATILWGGALPQRAAFADLTRPRLIDIGQTLHRLRDALQEAYDGLPRSHPSFYVAAAGVQKGRVPRVAAYEIKDRSPSGPHVFEISKVPRDISRGSFFLLQSLGVLLREEEEELRSRIRDCQSVDDVENALVTTVRYVSDRDSRVGADCMSIAIASALDPNTRARFIPRAAESRILGEGSLAAHGGLKGEWRGTPVQIGFSPYILGQNTLHFPSELVGSITVGMGDFNVLLDVPDPGIPRIGVSSQVRRRRP